MRLGRLCFELRSLLGCYQLSGLTSGLQHHCSWGALGGTCH
jgi:hypothetical protein